MTTTVRAVFENGVFRPTAPPPLANGQEVELTVTPVPKLPPPANPAEALDRIRSARTLAELFAAQDAAAAFEPSDGYDLIEELENERRACGMRPLFDPPYRKDQS